MDGGQNNKGKQSSKCLINELDEPFASINHQQQKLLLLIHSNRVKYWPDDIKLSRPAKRQKIFSKEKNLQAEGKATNLLDLLDEKASEQRQIMNPISIQVPRLSGNNDRYHIMAHLFRQ